MSSLFDGHREQLRTLLDIGFTHATSGGVLAFLRQVAATKGFLDMALGIPRDPTRGYARQQLLVEGRGELAVVVLAPGDIIRPHDHGEYDHEEAVVGALLVTHGCETNTFFEIDPDGPLKTLDTTVVKAGESLVLDASTIHSVENRSGEPAVSLHVYLHAQTDPRTRKKLY